MRVRVQATAAGPAILAVSRALGIGTNDVKRLLSQECVLPAQLTADQASALRDALVKLGVGADLVDVPASSARCGAHPTLTAEHACAECRAATCPLCGASCASCAAKRVRAQTWKGRRVAVLLVVLLVVGFGAALRWQKLHRRTEWTRSLRVSVVLVSSGDVAPATVRAWENGLEALQTWFATQSTRHGLTLQQPIVLSLSPEVKTATLPALVQSGDVLADVRAARAYADELAKVASSEGDVRLVVVLGDDVEGPARVEGIGERGGVYGMVRASRQDTELTLELMALAHELFHCLGADDAYDPDGHAVFPSGFVEPEREPRFPQPAAEVMCGEIPLTEASGRLPKSLKEVAAGDTTARAIGWLR